MRISDKINISAGHKEKNKNGERAEVQTCWALDSKWYNKGVKMSPLRW